MHLHRRPAAYLVPAVLAVAAVQPPALAVVAQVAPAEFDARRNAIVIPYLGQFPPYYVGTLDNPPRVVAIDGTDIAGGIANQAAELVRCIQLGNLYDATVLTVNGGAVRVRIARR